jgi:hypothetical protein
MTALAVVLVGIFLIVQSQTRVTSTLELLFGIVVAILAVLDLTGGVPWRRG